MRASLVAIAVVLAFSALTATAQDRPAEEPADSWRWPGNVLFSVSTRVAFPFETDFDLAMSAHRYGSVRAVPAVVLGLGTPVFFEWLQLSIRGSVRGRGWDHPENADASLFGVDLLAHVEARLPIVSWLELGIGVGGGVGYLSLVMNDVAIDQGLGRLNVESTVAIAIGRNFTMGPRFGYDYFQWSTVNRYGHGVDAGGLYFALTLEGRE